MYQAKTRYQTKYIVLIGLFVILLTLLGTALFTDKDSAQHSNKTDLRVIDQGTNIDTASSHDTLLVVVHDDARSVTCWIASARGAGITCIADAQLTNTKKEETK